MLVWIWLAGFAGATSECGDSWPVRVVLPSVEGVPLNLRVPIAFEFLNSLTGCGPSDLERWEARRAEDQIVCDRCIDGVERCMEECALDCWIHGYGQSGVRTIGTGEEECDDPCTDVCLENLEFCLADSCPWD